VARHKVALVLIALLALGFVIPFTLMHTGGGPKPIQEIRTGLHPATVTTQP
jgi:hypothetical protein